MVLVVNGKGGGSTTAVSTHFRGPSVAFFWAIHGSYLDPETYVYNNGPKTSKMAQKAIVVHTSGVQVSGGITQ